MGSVENYRLVSVRKVAVYPNIMLEGKLEVAQRHKNEKQFIYLVFDIDEVDNSITEESDFWCYQYPFDEMYDNTKYFYDIEPVDAISIMIQMQEAWENA